MLGKSTGLLNKKFASFNRRKLLCKLKFSNYQCTGKNARKNKSRYIPSIIIIYHCYYRITLLLFFIYHSTNTPRVFHVETTWKRVVSTWNTRDLFAGQIPKDCDFPSTTKCCTYFSIHFDFALTERAFFC